MPPAVPVAYQVDGVLGSTATVLRKGCPDRSPLVTLTGITDQVAPPSVLVTGPISVAARMVVAARRLQAKASNRASRTKRGDAKLSDAEIQKWTGATAMMPTDGVVLKTALEATKGKSTDIEKLRAAGAMTH